MIDNRRNNHETACPVCHLTEVTIFLEIPQVPVHCNVLWSTREEALQAPKGDLRLGFCAHCGHIFNLAFNPELLAYSQQYENSLHFSPRFQTYAESIALRLIERYGLRNKDVIDIGCGKGDFLTLLCELGANRGVGFDPSYVPGSIETAAQITFVQDFYSERYTHYKADLICCRHLLEHIQYPHDILADVRRSIGNRRETVVFFEVPNVLFTLRDLGIWDLIYEHCSYFSASSLRYLFSSCGFDVLGLTEVYEGQFLTIEALPNECSHDVVDDSQDELVQMTNVVAAFADKYHTKTQTWRTRLESIGGAGKRVVIWGAGSKGVTFLNVLETRDQIAYAVDINPRKQGMYLAGTGQQIVSHEFLRDYRPDVVMVMNPIYADEIRQIVERLGCTPEFMVV